MKPKKLQRALLDLCDVVEELQRTVKLHAEQIAALQENQHRLGRAQNELAEAGHELRTSVSNHAAKLDRIAVLEPGIPGIGGHPAREVPPPVSRTPIHACVALRERCESWPECPCGRAGYDPRRMIQQTDETPDVDTQATP